jgi:uncharacterized protein (DUF488 family)
MTDRNLALYTIGHSNQSLDEFIALLHGHSVEVLVDVRSAPYSRWAPHFGKESLEHALKLAGLRYLYLGRELGGRPDADRRSDLYDADGHALYYKMAQEDGFNDAIRRLHEGVARFRVAVMCSEEDPTDCHRRLLIGKVMTERWNVQLRHIRRGGHVDDEWLVDLARETQPRQRSLLPKSTCEAGERDMDALWRSTRSVSGG